MENKLFIGNVAFETKIETLVEMFSQFGEITDSYKPLGKGFAFITFKDEASAQKAIEEMNGKEVEGRQLVVNVARPREERPMGGSRGGFGGGDRGGFGGDRRPSRGGFGGDRGGRGGFGGGFGGRR
jgi:RNA recognition motif-containing protein